MFKDKRALVLALGIFALLIGGVSLYKTNVASGTTDQEQFQQTVRNALAELNFSTGNSPLTINAATNNLANFIRYRSGVQLSQTNKDSLSLNEQKAQTESKRITQAQLADILTTVACEKLVTLSDSDIDAMAESLRGFNSPNLLVNYPGFRQSVVLRADGEGTMDPAVFIAQLKDARAAEINYQNQLAIDPKTARVPFSRMALRSRLNTEITERSNYLVASSPDFFNGATNNDLTPTQSMLLTYSIITDDMLAGNQAELQSKLNGMRQGITQYTGRLYPSPQNHRAYGVNGYIFSTPTNLLFDDAVATRVLNLIKEKGNL
jgi:hypothetical protein